MKKATKLGVLVAVALVMGLAAARTASAQTEIGIGYQFVRLNTFEVNYPVGINADVAVPLSGNDMISIIGEVGWSRHSDGDFDFTSNLLNLGGGVRLNAPVSGQFSPYGQVIVGLQHDSDKFFGDTDTFNSFMLGLDGGVQAPLNESWDYFGQFGYRRVQYEGDAANGFRFVVGARVKLR